MEKIDFFILFLPVMLADGSKSCSVDTPRDLLGFKAMQVDQSINDLSNSLVLILLLVTLIFILLFGIAVCHIIRRLIRIGRAYREFISSRWVEDPDIRRRKAEETDLSQEIFTEQQWLLSEWFSQYHEDGDALDYVDHPHDWWS
jgi:hypothetical protein